MALGITSVIPGLFLGSILLFRGAFGKYTDELDQNPHPEQVVVADRPDIVYVRATTYANYLDRSLFAKFDKDGDGLVSMAELAWTLNTKDVNGDNKLSLEELKGMTIDQDLGEIKRHVHDETSQVAYDYKKTCDDDSEKGDKCGEGFVCEQPLKAGDVQLYLASCKFAVNQACPKYVTWGEWPCAGNLYYHHSKTARGFVASNSVGCHALNVNNKTTHRCCIANGGSALKRNCDENDQNCEYDHSTCCSGFADKKTNVCADMPKCPVQPEVCAV